MRALKHFVAAAAAVCLLGCQAYRAQPLTAEAVDKALLTPEPAQLKVEAQALKHPLLQPVAVDLADGLSPDEAAVLAVLVNPSLRSIRDGRALADAQLLQAGLLPNPQLAAGFDKPTGGATKGTFNAYDLGLDWDVSALVGRRAGIEAAAAGRAAIDLDVAWQEWQVAQAARLAVYDLISLQEQVALATEMTHRLADNLAVVRKAVTGGLMTELDLAAAETASNQAQANLVDLTRQAGQQRLALNQALGLPPATQVTLQEGLELPSHLGAPAEQAILSGLEERRLDLVALRRGYESQEATVRKAVLEQFPKINIGLNEARDTSNVITTGLAVSVGLPIFDRNQGAIAQEQATRQRLFDEYVNRIFETRAEIARLLDNARGIEEQLRVAQEAEPGLQHLVDTYRLALDKGQADVLSYYTAWNDLTAKRLEVVTFKQQLADTQIALEIAAGVYQLSALEQPAAGPGQPSAQPATDEVKQ